MVCQSFLADCTSPERLAIRTALNAAAEARAAMNPVDRRFLRSRPLSFPVPEALADALAREETNYRSIEPFGEGRRFATSADFLACWKEYEKDTVTKYSSRGSDRVAAWNKKRAKAFRKKKISLGSDEYKQGIVPEKLGHGCIIRRCIHGLLRKPRGKGQRPPKKSRYRDCPARITLSPERDEDGNWSLVTRNEFSQHSHKCTQQMITDYGSSALRTNPEIARQVLFMLQAKATSANIYNAIQTNFGVEIKPKHISNLKRDMLGFQDAVTNLGLLLDKFAALPGCRRLILDDKNGDLAAVVTQSAAQREMFDLYGDNLVLDWTHNTNNMGLYLGSLMVTSASGHGVSVCDFLCVEQTEDMMTMIFEYFLEVTPGAVDKVKSIVIDKDYKEWRVLERLFPNSAVLLCQFHVAKWFGHVVTMKKYELSVPVRDCVLRILNNMIYAPTISEFDMLVSDLSVLLRSVCPAFLEYMEARWYGCRRMWSDCERSKVFSALNTTTNRIESSWNQIKSMLGKKLRIDLCMEAIFAYQSAVMRRECRIFSEHENSLILRSEVDRFMRLSMTTVSDYVSEKVANEWSRYREHDDDSERPYVCSRSDGVTMITRGVPGATTYEVEERSTQCSCDFAATSALPCRHSIYVARRILGYDEFPRDAINARWRISSAFGFLPHLRVYVTQLQTLRTHLLVFPDSVFSTMIEQDVIESDSASAPRKSQVAYRRLKHREISDTEVLSDVDKRNMVWAAVGDLIMHFQSQSMPVFVRQFTQFKAGIQQLLVRPGTIRTEESSDAALPDPTKSLVLPVDDVGPQLLLNMRDGGVRHSQSTNVALPGPARSVNSPEKDLSQTVSCCSTEDPASPISAFMDALLDADDDLDSILPPHSSNSCPMLQMMSPFRSPLSSGIPSATPGISFMLNPVDEEEQHEEMSAMMAKVAHLQLFKDASPAKQMNVSPSAPATKPTTRTPKLDAQWIHERFGLEGVSDAFDSRLCDMHANGSVESTTGLTKRKLHESSINGRPKRQRSSGPSRGRSEYLEQDSPCPIDLAALCVALLYTRDLEQVLLKMDKYPRRLDEASVDMYVGEAAFAFIRVEDFVVNFRVRRKLVRTLKKALLVLLSATRLLGSGERVDLSELGTPGVVDLTTTNKATSTGSVSEAVVTLAPHIRRFSQDNIVNFERYFAIRDMCKNYKLDKMWIERSGDATVYNNSVGADFSTNEFAAPYDVPYLHDRLIARGLRDGTNVSTMACRSILHVLTSTAANTTFQIRAWRQDLNMVIKVSEVIGFLARKAELNDCVLMYALRQIANDYNDVHVVDCLEGPMCPPILLFGQTRVAIFPLNFNRLHWCVVVVVLYEGVVRSVWLYDPLQGEYQTSLSHFWQTVGWPYMANWGGRDGVLLPPQPPHPRTLRIPIQHDPWSCGVYCIAAALDFVTDTPFFSAARCQLPLAIPQLRIRIMWRIFCDSERIDHHREEDKAYPTLAIVDTFAEDTKTKVATRKEIRKIAKQSNRRWREL